MGLSGSFGRVGLGRGMAPNFLPTILTNPFGDSFTISPLVLHANMSTGGWNKDINGTTGTDTGWSNQIVYSTPNMGGLKANVHYQFGEQTAAGQRGKRMGVNALYGAGPLSLAAFYERVQISGPGLQVQDSKTDWMLGALMTSAS
ncbi:porin [Staphylococcus epidermidis]|nr:porin [Staphylococcus epidermidis]